MGRHLLRRKALTTLAALLVLSPLLGSEEAPAYAPEPTEALPPVQGHEGPEVYSIAIPDEDIIGGYEEGYLASRRDWLQAVLDASARYRPMIVEALAARGLPRELQFLPAVESAFQVRAVSPQGAAGLWQLMRNTASPYGLRMDLWLDERRDAWKATAASVAKLAENRAIFGDWHLAIAAYNCGVGKLSAIVRKNPGSGFWALRRKGVLPRETAAFVPQFLALCRILSHPWRYGLAAGWDPAPEPPRMVPLDRCVDLRILSRAAGIPLATLVEANPELNFLVTPPSSYAYMLKVPVANADAVERTLAGASMPLLEFRVHVVAKGDTLYGMSLRYGISVEMIQEFNPRVEPRFLRIGARLLIPVLPVRNTQ
jgi:membrane-bound lytic murein transglycosylase D